MNKNSRRKTWSKQSGTD